MAEPAPTSSAVPVAPPEPPAALGQGPRKELRFALRRSIPTWQAVLMGITCLCVCLGLWWLVTRGEPDERIISPSKGLSSPSETFASFPSLWFKRALTRNLLTTLRRLCLGFGLAALVGVPLGVLCGCFRRVEAFFMPLTLFGRNTPVAALIPLTFSLFGIDEQQKVIFIFIACVAFVLWDTTRAIQEVGGQYIDTAYTLGAGTWQIIGKVLLPLALPSVFNSLRLLFGLAFGYIMLAEVVTSGGESGGVGALINISQRLGPLEHVILILLIIPVVALFIDRVFYFIQAELFPYRYGGMGILHRHVRGVLHTWEDLRLAVWNILSGLLGRRGAKSPTPTDGPAT
jgi:ABC-type nitrate/sulfonate/bicarbonate transport system permease component